MDHTHRLPQICRDFSNFSSLLLYNKKIIISKTDTGTSIKVNLKVSKKGDGKCKMQILTSKNKNCSNV